MEIVTGQAEDRLVELLSLVQKQPEAWMCVHVNIAPAHAQALHHEGLSRESLARIRELSVQIAQKLNGWGLDHFDGKILIFEDSDVLAIFRHDPASIESVITRLRKEFTANGLLHILAIYAMQERLGDIMSLAAEKHETARDYLLKRRAIEVAEDIFKGPVQDAELTRMIQKKRRERGVSCVLVIEDDVLTRGLVATCLKSAHKVVQAKDAQSGISAYIDNAPDVVFLDIELPDVNGGEILNRIMVLDPQAYVVMLSAHSEKDNILSTRAHGAAGFICKPFSKEKLLEYISKCPSLGMDPALRALGWRKVEPEN